MKIEEWKKEIENNKEGSMNIFGMLEDDVIYGVLNKVWFRRKGNKLELMIESKGEVKKIDLIIKN